MTSRRSAISNVTSRAASCSSTIVLRCAKLASGSGSVARGKAQGERQQVDRTLRARSYQSENRYTEGALKHIEKLQQRLYTEMRGRIKESDASVPEKIDDYYYYSRTETGKQYAIHCRKKGSLDAKEEVLLDENELAKGQKYFRIGTFSISPVLQKLLAYSTDTDGSESYTLRVKSLETGTLAPDEIKNCSYSFAWANDDKTFFL